LTLDLLSGLGEHALIVGGVVGIMSLMSSAVSSSSLVHNILVGLKFERACAEGNNAILDLVVCAECLGVREWSWKGSR